MMTYRRRSQNRDNVYAVAEALRLKYKDYAHNNRRNPLDELLFILCSVKTTGPSYRSTYRIFRNTFPKFEDIAQASECGLATALSSGGLQNIKAKAIKRLTGVLNECFGKPTLSPLRKMTDEESEKFLVSLPGVGKKVARCIMMYSLDRQVFPVDTHCWRVASRLGWIRGKSSTGHHTDRDADRLQEKIPKELRFSLHVNMVSLGRNICTFHNPKCVICPISIYCNNSIAHT